MQSEETSQFNPARNPNNPSEVVDAVPLYLRLIVHQGVQTGEVLAGEPGKSEWRIGRSNANDIVLNDTLASRIHAIVIFQEGDDRQALLVDNNSVNGILLNGTQVDNQTGLKNGDLIQIGETVMEVAGVPTYTYGTPASGTTASATKSEQPATFSHKSQGVPDLTRPSFSLTVSPPENTPAEKEAEPENSEAANHIEPAEGANNSQISLTRKGKAKKSARKTADEVDSDFDRVAVSRQFHRLIRQLDLSPSLRTPLVIGITSSVRGEGRTTVALGLASGLAETVPLPIVLIETDLEQPVLAQDLNLDQAGLSDYILGELPIVKLTQATKIPGLVVIPAGSANGQALRILRDEGVSNLFSLLRQQFAAIIVDLPPMFMTGEADRVISQIDRVLMVVEAGSTPRKIVKSFLELIPEEKVAGVVLNRTRPALNLWGPLKKFRRR